MSRSEIYYLMKLVEKSAVPPWVDKKQLIIALQNDWIKKIHEEKKV